MSGITTSILGAMKAIKLTGLGSQVSSLLIQCRVNELAAARRFRNLTSISVAIGKYTFSNLPYHTRTVRA
jgi:ATP-binding cassette subfamily C (CFTR/MRP) protein 1